VFDESLSKRITWLHLVSKIKPCIIDMHWQRLGVHFARLSDAHSILLMVQAVRRIQATPGFTGKAAEAAAAYHKQRQQAATAVELVRRRYAVPAGQALSWMKRPDVQKVAPMHPTCTGPDS